MAYSQTTANALNLLIAQGLTAEQAFDQLGVPEDDAGFYTVDEVGTPADNPNFGRIESAVTLRVAASEPQPIDPDTNPGYGEEDAPEDIDERQGITEPVDGISPFGEEDDRVDPDAFGPDSVTDTGGYPTQTLAEITAGGDPGLTPDQAEAQATAQAEADTRAKLDNAQQQGTIQQRRNQTTAGDWRVRIRLGPEADYLYLSSDPGILAPLKEQDGVIFPYVPQIQTNYVAKYDSVELTHSNYRGYFYRNSHVSDIQITGAFTAQDTREAAYLLAVIHFFRSVTKMFYGQDPQRGAPPPLVMLSGYGEYQFNDHPCLVSSFNYNLPNGVDYIPVMPNNQGLNLAPRRNLVSSSPGSTIQSVVNRLANAGLPRGATPERLDLGSTSGTVNGTQRTTYVPTNLELQITLLPVQTRQQVSQQFSLKNFANGNLLKGGFW